MTPRGDSVEDSRENFRRLIDSLLDTYSPVGVSIWLSSPNRHLGDRPSELMARGDWQPLLDEADRLAGGPLG